MTSTTLKIAILFSTFLFSVDSFAGQQTGKIVKISVRASDGLIFVDLDGVASGRPECARYTYWMIKDENSAAGKRQYAQLLAARASGQVVTIHGTGNCTRWADGEDIDVVTL